jgi:hypothetical protein
MWVGVGRAPWGLPRQSKIKRLGRGMLSGTTLCPWRVKNCHPPVTPIMPLPSL